MAKPKATGRGLKLSFAKKVTNGKAKKNHGPKESRPKRYRGQGR